MYHCAIVPWDPMGHPTCPWNLPPVTGLRYMVSLVHLIVPWYLWIHGTSHQSLVWVRVRARARLGLVGHPMRSQGSETMGWDG